MSQDGAHLGVKADRALGTILGGEEQPTEEDRSTPAELLDEIREVNIAGPHDYGSAALAMAKILLEAFERYPALREHPTENIYLRSDDGNLVFNSKGGLVCLQHGLYDVLKDLHPDEDSPERRLMSDLTGFMWGWAVNAVGFALGDPPKPNPAILEVES